MQDINSVVLVGNLVRDCELKYMQSGNAIGNISIACNRNKKQADGTWGTEVSYFDIVLFGKTAENLKQYLTKGKKVAVQGFLKQDRWTDQQGNNRSRISVIAESIELFTPMQNQHNGGYQQNPGVNQQQIYPTAQAMSQADAYGQSGGQGFVPQQQNSFQSEIPMESDIPF